MTTTAFLPMTASPEFIAAHTKADKPEGHNIKVGDILVEEWGATMCLVNYYQVVGTKGKSTLLLHEIGSDEQATGFLSGRSSPKKGDFLKLDHNRQILTRRVKNSWNGK